MEKTSKLSGSKIAHSSESPRLLEMTDSYLSRLIQAQGTENEVREIIINLAREVDENHDLAELFLKKIMALRGSFNPWFLVDLNQRVRSKAVKKDIKRTLYLLKQKGIEPPSSTDKQEKQEGGILKTIESFQGAAYLSEFDGLRNQMLGLLIPKPDKGLLFVFALIGREGLESFQAVEVKKREVKDILADLEKQGGHTFFQADFSHTAYILQEAHDRHSKLSKEEEGVYAGIMTFLSGKKMVGKSPIIRILLTEEKLPPSSSDIRRLLQVPEIFYILPEPGILAAHQQAIHEVQTGILILNEIQKRERILAIVDKAVRELFPPERRPGLKRYLEEVAYIYLLKKRPAEAEALMYWAKTLDEEKVPRPGQENPLLFWLMETVLLAKEGGKTPGQEQKEKTTEGGIILPSWVRTEEDGR